MPLDGRRWIYVAIDCASRCILGLSVCSQPNSDAARRILGQILTDKTELARAAGAEGSWDFFGSPHLICTDTGSAFSSNMFILAVNTLGAIMLFPPVKIPELRSRIERAFGTMARKIMPLLPGRTFNNPIARGDYPSEQRTVLTDDDLTRILTINDPTVTLLVRKSLLPARMVRHPRSRRPMGLISSEALSAFLKEHATLGMMAYAAKTQAKHVATRLEKAGIEPLPLGERFSKIYRRSAELENLFDPGEIS